MSTTVSRGRSPAASSTTDGAGPGRPRLPQHRLTRSLLAWGVVAGPFSVLVSLSQVFVRDAFDPVRHDRRLLANRPGGWVQTTNLEAEPARFCPGGITTYPDGQQDTWPRPATGERQSMCNHIDCPVGPRAL